MNTKDAGRLGAKVRHGKPTEELRQIALKAAATRKKKDPDVFRKMGMLGGAARHNKSAKELRGIALKAAASRKKKDPDSFRKMGRKGGKAKAKSR